MNHLLATMLTAILLLCVLPSRSDASTSAPDYRDATRDATSGRIYVHRPIRLADSDILPVSTSRELSILYFLGITRGHLLASIELAKSGKLDQSVLHSRHALDEAWIELADLLSTEDSQALRPKIEAVNEAIALKSPLSEIIAAHEDTKALIDKIAAASSTAGEAKTYQSLDLILLLLKQALAEYEEAWDNLELKDRVEYQDGFGFVAVANAELQAIFPALRAKNSQAVAEIEKTVERLTRAWPSPEPPHKPVMSKPVLRALVTAVEINARQFPR
jgi:hypothetical protein